MTKTTKVFHLNPAHWYCLYLPFDSHCREEMHLNISGLELALTGARLVGGGLILFCGVCFLRLKAVIRVLSRNKTKGKRTSTDLNVMYRPENNLYSK